MEINSQFKIKISGQDSYLICTKFRAMECLHFITRVIKLLPEKHEVSFFSRSIAEAIIMKIMDTGIDIPLNEEQKKEYKNLVLDQDYFALLFRTAYINADEYEQNYLSNELLRLFLYNNQQIDEETKNLIFSNMKVLFSAMLHAIRYNYNSFFIIDEN